MKAETFLAPELHGQIKAADCLDERVYASVRTAVEEIRNFFQEMLRHYREQEKRVKGGVDK